MALSWNDLFLSGSIVDLATSMWRARIQIKAADLGIEDSVDVQKALALGCHRLAPKEAFDAIMEPATAARRAVDHYSLTFGLIRGARYVPDKNIAILLDKLRGFRAEFEREVGKFIAAYADIKAKQLPVIEKALLEAAKTPEAAKDAIARIRAEYPSADDIRAKFSLSWTVYAVQGAQSAAAAASAADETESIKGVVRDMVSQLREEVQGKLADVLGLISKGGALKERSIESAMAVLDRVDTLNVLGDRSLSQQVKALRSALGSIEAGKRLTDGEVAGLEGIKESLAGSLEEAVKAAERNLAGVGKRKIAAGGK